MKIEIFEKAREMGEQIAASEEFRRLQRAQGAYDADAATQDCLIRVEALQEKMQISGDDFIALKELEMLKTEVAQLKEQVAASRILLELREANNAFNALMEEVNQVISFVITGEAAETFRGDGVTLQDSQVIH